MWNRSSVLALTCLLLVLACHSPNSPDLDSQCVPLVAISPYLGQLQDTANYATYSSGRDYYKWSDPAPFPDAQKVTSGGFTNCTRVYQGSLCVCVQFARQVCNVPDSPSTAWRRSVPVVVNGQIRTDLTAGALVATMDSMPGGLYRTNYHPHVAVFLRRINNDSIEVADQNFIADSIVGKHHRIRTASVGGSLASDATRYWTIYVNQ